MADREKVIKGLEQFIADFKPFCGNKSDWQRVDDALALLREQEPHLLTLKEVKTAEDCMEPVFLEMYAESESPDVFSWRTVKHIVPLTDNDIYVLDNVGFSSALYSEHYGMTWRCWNERPTDEQRKAVKWDDRQTKLVGCVYA